MADESGSQLGRSDRRFDKADNPMEELTWRSNSTGSSKVSLFADKVCWLLARAEHLKRSGCMKESLWLNTNTPGLGLPGFRGLSLEAFEQLSCKDFLPLGVL